jgi:hypothetical protein
MKKKKEREVNDNMSLKKNLSTKAEETTKVQLCVMVFSNGNVDPKFAPLENFDLGGVPGSQALVATTTTLMTRFWR